MLKAIHAQEDRQSARCDDSAFPLLQTIAASMLAAVRTTDYFVLVSRSTDPIKE